LTGVSTKAELIDSEGNIPRCKQALMADAIGTTAGAILGASTVTTYAGNSAGVAEGGKTGLTALTTAILFIIALFLSPLFPAVPAAATAPALSLTGLFMMTPVKGLDLSNYTESIPAFPTLIIMPLSYSIATGIMIGMISWLILKLCTGKVKEINIMTTVIGVLFIIKLLVRQPSLSFSKKFIRQDSERIGRNMGPCFLDLNSVQWGFIAVCAMFIGMSKAGVPGVSLLAVPILAFIFGGKQSTGMLVPMLMMADLFGVGYYRRHAQWSYLIKILPWAFVGIGLALWVGGTVNDRQFKTIIAVLVFMCIGLMLFKDRSKGKQVFPDKWWLSASLGVLGGFASMIGNAAGPVFAIYLLARHLPKNNFIGTSAWFFLIVNFSKFPLQLLVWKTISRHTLVIDILNLPVIALGVFLGIKLVKILPEKTFRRFVIMVTALSGLLLLL
jgi:uncharacterized membrane protein YfcA